MAVNLSAEVRKLSKQLNISLSEIARRTGQSPANLSKKLSKETLSFEDFEKILDVLGVKLRCGFVLPGQKETVAGTDRRTENRMAILEKELEVAQLKNEYYREAGFAFRTALETISGGTELLANHSDDPQRVQSCIEHMKTALAQLVNIADNDPMMPRTETAAAAGRNTASFGGRRVLVVDDNAINRDIVTELLSDSGLLAEQAPGGAEAVECVRAHPQGYYDFILMDLQMPETDGFAAAAAIRALPGGRADVPVIAMTAGGSDADREKAAAAGMNGFAMKPLDLKKLFEILSH